MRVLVITPTPTHPATQGNRVRVAQIAGALKAEGAWVEVLYYAIDGYENESIEEMRAAWDVLYTVSLGGFIPRRAHPAHWGLDDWISPRLLEATRFLADSSSYDIVVINYVWLSLLLDVFAGLRTVRVLDTHDAFGGRHELARSAGMQPHWFYTTEEEEGRGLDRADLVLAIQSDEAQYFRRVSKARIATIEYAAPPRFLPYWPKDPLTIGYLGSGNPWNVRSVEEFDRLLAQDLPFVKTMPRFMLFGGITRQLAELEIMRSIGMVDDVPDAYSLMDLVVNPMIGGTGLKIKTVEALAFGRPVLSTKAGGAGLEAIHPDLLHEDLPALIARLHRLVENPEELLEVANGMRAGYERFHSDVEKRLNKLFFGQTGPALVTDERYFNEASKGLPL